MKYIEVFKHIELPLHITVFYFRHVKWKSRYVRILQIYFSIINALCEEHD